MSAGKSTLLSHVPRNRQQLRVAVIVNDRSEVNIHVLLVRNEQVLQDTGTPYLRTAITRW